MNIALLQANPALDKLPGFLDFIHIYGWWLGLIVVLIAVILILQFYWFNRIVRAKDAEIKRLVAHENVLAERLMKLIPTKAKQ